MSRRLIAPALVFLILFPALAFGDTPTVPPLAAFDEATLRQADLPTDAAGLLAVLRGFLRTDADSKKIATLIAQLGSPQFDQREQAMADLIAIGRPAVEALRMARQEHSDTEVRRRAEFCVAHLDKMLDPAIAISVVRRLLFLRAVGSAELLLQLLTETDWNTREEIVRGLQWVAKPHGKLDPALLAALGDKSELRRATAALAVALVGDDQERLRVRKLLADHDPEVRLRAAQGLLASHEETSLPVLVALLNERNRDISWSAEELLHWVALKNVPTETVGAFSADERKKAVEAWTAWLNSPESQIDWKEVEEAARRPGIYFACSKTTVRLMGCDGKRWVVKDELESLPLCLSKDQHGKAELPNGGNIVVLNSHQRLVVLNPHMQPEVSELRVLNPWSVEILRNGHYLITTTVENRILELDSTGRTLSETYLGEQIEHVHSILERVRIGFDKPRAPDFNLDSAANRVRGLKDADPEVRRRSAVFLNFIKPTDAASIEALAVALDDESSEARSSVSQTLLHIGQPALPTLIRKLQHGTPRTRKTVASILTEMGVDAKDALPALAVVATSSSERLDVREASLEALGALGTQADTVISLLQNVLEDPGQPESIRCGAARGLGRLAAVHKRRPPEFNKLLYDPDTPRILAISLLQGLTSSNDGEATIMQILNQGDRSQRCLVIGLCDNSELGEVALLGLRLATRDGDKTISELARTVIHNIGERNPETLIPLRANRRGSVR